MLHSSFGVWILLANWCFIIGTAKLHSFFPSFSSQGPHRPLGSSFGIAGKNATYDYIVVGGGTAGLTLATRLAESSKGWTVAVVEAGTFYEIGNGNLSEIPAFNDFYGSKAADDWQPLVDWGYVTTPQEHAYNARIHYPRGKCLGGSSARNYMVYQRGTKASYQLWADRVADQSYAFDNFLPHFEKHLNFTPPDQEKRFANSTPTYDDAVLGSREGPLSLTYPNYAHVFASWITNGLTALGIDTIPGFLSGSLIGQSYCMTTINPTTMRRESSETSFLRKALEYPNYIVYHLTMAKYIVFGSDKRADGVMVDTMGAKYYLSARKEIVVSAGVIGSPQLLMVSGIGPVAKLKELGIPVVADMPGVGQNMQDHIYFGPSYRVNGLTTSAFQNASFVYAATHEYNKNESGMLTNPAVDVLAWEKVPIPLRASLSDSTQQELDKYPADWPELEYIGINAYLGYQLIAGGSDPRDGHNYASVAAALCAPRSRGSVTITSADNAVHPEINPNFLSDRADVEVSIAAYKRLRQLWALPSIKPFLADPEETFPGLNVSTDAQLEEIIKKSFHTVKHGACTCAMGVSSDRMAVVNSQAQVYGVTSLRVVDASVFPFLPPGHPMSTVYALAEKIAAIMTEDDGDQLLVR